jgi:hypothetical protein
MGFPSYLIELQFGSSGYVDVTSDAGNVTIGKGISRSLDDYSAGTLQVSFTNNSRRFDPLNTSSDLWYGAGGYSMVQPGGTIRVSAKSASGSYVRIFTGTIQGWSFTYDMAGLDGNANVTAVDALFKVANQVLTAGTQGYVEATTDRMKRLLGVNNFGASEYAGINSGGVTLLGSDVNNNNDNLLTYLQNVARSEPGDFYANSSAVITFKDRSFTNYTYSNVIKQNWTPPPSNLSASTSIGTAYPTGWTFGTAKISSSGPYEGGTAHIGAVVGTASKTGFIFNEVNTAKYNPTGAVNGTTVFSFYTNPGTSVATDISANLYMVNSANSAISTASVSWTFGGGWELVQGTSVWSGNPSGIYFQVLSAGTVGVAFWTNGIIVEPAVAGATAGQYFDGGYTPYLNTSTTRYDVAWLGTPLATSSGMVISTASTATAPTVLTFADANSQGAAYGNGTGIPFTDLQVDYGSEQMYNNIQVVGSNATATASDTALVSRYGNKAYTQTDNLTVSLTRPTTLATSFLAEYRLPEYRAQQIIIALESLTDAQQTSVLSIELRDVVRVCFQPSATGAVVAKYYQVLAVNHDADPERSHVTLKLSSLERLPIRLDSTLLAILDTSILA